MKPWIIQAVLGERNTRTAAGSGSRARGENTRRSDITPHSSPNALAVQLPKPPARSAKRLPVPLVAREHVEIICTVVFSQPDEARLRHGPKCMRVSFSTITAIGTTVVPIVQGVRVEGMLLTDDFTKDREVPKVHESLHGCFRRPVVQKSPANTLGITVEVTEDRGEGSVEVPKSNARAG